MTTKYHTAIATKAAANSAVINAPLAELDAAIDRTLGSGTSFPGSPSEGDRFYRTDQDKFYMYDGAGWKEILSENTTDKVGATHIDPAAAWGASDKKLLNLVPYTNANNVLYLSGITSTDFVATISSINGADVVYNDPTSGSEVNIDPQSSSEIGKLVLHNTTRGNSAKISDVNTGTNTITLTASAPGDWVATDTITIRSQTCQDGSRYYYDLDLSGFLPSTAPVICLFFAFEDTQTASARSLRIHPYETRSAGKEVELPINPERYTNLLHFVPVTSQKICLSVAAGGATTANLTVKCFGWFEEAAK